MPRKRTASRILESLANERRVIAADWRIHIAHVRIARSDSLDFPNTAKTRQQVWRLLTAGDMERVEGVSGVYRVTTPYASVLPCPDEAVIQEASPGAVFSHFTAAAHHGLTDESPREFHLTHFGKGSSRLPLGTTPEDWIEVPRPCQRTPDSIRRIPVFWHKSKPSWDFGCLLRCVEGSPIYITDPERTLLDALRFPDRCGGETEVLRVWRRAVPSLRVDVLIDYVERFGQALLKQRVGYLLDRLEVAHPRLQEWADNSVRGSSARLFAAVDFSSTYSQRWNLSINASDAGLSELDET